VDMPRIFEAAMDKDMLNIFNEKNINLMNNGSIVAGMNDLIIGVAKLHEMHGTYILVETSGYVVDAKASKTILECLSSIL
jgi:proteasome assembly chaperone (PAC2) family protein